MPNGSILQLQTRPISSVHVRSLSSRYQMQVRRQSAITKMILFSVLTLFLELSHCALHTNPLQGKHMRLFFPEFHPYLMLKRNASGHIVEASGGVIERLNWLSRSLEFTYSAVQLPRQKSPDESLKYILNGEADWFAGVLVITVSRNRLFDLPHPWVVDRANLILPYPSQTANIRAPLEPFALYVWISLIAALIMTIVTIYVLNLLHEHSPLNRNPNKNLIKYSLNTISKSTDYVVAVLLSQGGVCYSKRLNTRLIAAAWCLASCVLVYAYSCVVISVVSAPNRQVLINSIEEMPSKPHVKLVVIKGAGTDLVISNYDGDAYKHLKDMLNRDPHLRCPNSSVCLEMVRSGSKVFIDGHSTAMSSINEDLKATGKCRYTIAKDGFSFTFVSFAVPKNSMYLEHLSKGVMRMWETGLINLWEKRTIPKPTVCLNIKQSPTDNPQLSLINLSGSFVILLFGYCASLLCFLGERLWHCYRPTAVKMIK